MLNLRSKFLQLLPVIVMVVGVFVVFHPMFSSSWNFLPGDPGDGRLNMYFLEHGWQWISGNPLHKIFWDAPFFYPLKNTMAFSDTLLSAGPIFWIFRATGMDYFTSFQLWAMTVFALNYVCMYIFLRRGLGISLMASAIGSFLFAFCAPRSGQLGHIQLSLHFFTPLCMYFITKAFANGRYTPFYIVIAGLCFACQLYASYYLGWFLAFSFCVFFIIAMFIKELRISIFMFIKNNSKWILISFIIMVVILLPLGIHYIKVLNEVAGGGRSFGDARSMLVRFSTLTNSVSYLYSSFANASLQMRHEHNMGIGLLSLVFVVYGLFLLYKSNRWGKVLSLTVIIVFLLSLSYFDGILWRMVRTVFPGATGIRAVSRIFFILLVGFSISIAFFANKLKVKWQLLILFIIIAEQLTPGGFGTFVPNEKATMASLVEVINRTDKPFFLIDSNDNVPYYITNIDAMWGALLTNKDTLNGYSGVLPFIVMNTSNIDVQNILPASMLSTYRRNNVDSVNLIVRNSVENKYEIIDIPIKVQLE